MAMFSMGSYKAPGPDGFQPVFFKSFWPPVAENIWELVAKAFNRGTFDSKLAETLIVPIPKVNVPSCF